DATVTGVQTCALPISERHRPSQGGRPDEEVSVDGAGPDARPERGSPRDGAADDPPPDATVRGALHRGPKRTQEALSDGGRRPPRSEERRVGKRGRSRI